MDIIVFYWLILPVIVDTSKTIISFLFEAILALFYFYINHIHHFYHILMRIKSTSLLLTFLATKVS